MKQRIEFIDLAKGICILLVVSYHIDLERYLYADIRIANVWFALTMPLFFFLSGIFISFDKGGQFLLQQKINKLIIPFGFFVLLGNLYGWIMKDCLHDYTMKWIEGDYTYVSPLFFAIIENKSMLAENNPIWFLVALFDAYILYWLIFKVTHNKWLYKGLLSLGVGIVGYYLGKNEINIPFYIDTAMTVLPFLFLGEFTKKKLDLLSPDKYSKYNILLAIILLVIVYYFSEGYNYFYENKYESSIWGLYLNGAIGSIAILLLCKNINRLPIISYIGEYSLIVLGIHALMIRELEVAFFQIYPNWLFINIMVLISVVILSLVAIKFLVKYLPWFVAQKDAFIFIENNK